MSSTRPSNLVHDLSGTVKVTHTSPKARGGWSLIYQGVFTGSIPNFQVAIKALAPVQTLEELGDEEKNDIRKRIRRELIAWNSLRHRNILKFMGVCTDLEYGIPEVPAMISPWCLYGHAGMYLKPRAARRFELGSNIILGVASALVHMHTRTPAVVHGDIKLTNVLVDSEGEACLTDFGLSRIVQDYPTGNSTSSGAGTARYFAPELIKDLMSDRSPRFTMASDVYAFGCLAIEVLTGLQPYHRTFRQERLTSDIRNVNIQPYSRTDDSAITQLDARLWEALQRCVHRDPAARPLARDIEIQFNSLLLRQNPSDSGHLASDILARLGIEGRSTYDVNAHTRIASIREKRFNPGAMWRVAIMLVSAKLRAGFGFDDT